MVHNRHNDLTPLNDAVGHNFILEDFMELSAREQAWLLWLRFPSEIAMRQIIGPSVTRQWRRMLNGRIRNPGQKTTQKFFRLIEGDYDETIREERIQQYAVRAARIMDQGLCATHTIFEHIEPRQKRKART